MKKILLALLFFFSILFFTLESDEVGISDIDSTTEEGITLLNDGNYLEAELIFRNILKEHKESHDALIGLGRSLLYQDRADESYKFFNQAVAEFNSDQAWFFRGHSQFKLGNRDQSREDYIEAINQGYKYFDAYFNIAFMYFQDKDYIEGESWFRQALDKNQDYAPSWYYLGLCRYQQNMDAYYEFSRTLEIDPGYVMAYIYRGILLDKIREYKRATEEFTKAVELDPDYAWAYFYLGRDQERINRPSEAIENLEKAVSLGLSDAKIFDALASSFWRMKKYDEAETNYNKAVELAPDGAWIINNRGFFYRQRKEYEKAIKDFKTAIKLDSEWALPYNNLGYTYNKQNKFRKAVDVLREAVRLAPNWSWPWNNLGSALKGIGLNEEAVESYNKSIDCDPEYSFPFYNLGILYHNAGKYEKAVESYKKALEINPRYSDSYNNLGNSLIQLGKLEEAIEVYTEGLEISPDHPLLLRNRGKQYFLTDQYEKAVLDLTESVELQPDSDYAQLYLGRSYVALGEYKEALVHLELATELNSSYASVLDNLISKLENLEEYLIVYLLWNNIPQEGMDVTFIGLPKYSTKYVSDSLGSVLIFRDNLSEGHEYRLYQGNYKDPDEEWDFSNISFYYSHNLSEVRLQIKKNLLGITPLDEETISDTTPLLQWDHPEEIESYTLIISKKGKELGNGIKSYYEFRKLENLTEPEYQINEALSPDEYLWSVTAFSADTIPLYYFSRTFTVE